MSPWLVTIEVPLWLASVYAGALLGTGIILIDVSLRLGRQCRLNRRLLDQRDRQLVDPIDARGHRLRGDERYRVLVALGRRAQAEADRRAEMN